MTATIIREGKVSRQWDELDSRLVTCLNPDSFEADQYRMLRFAIERACPSTGCRVVAITSSIPGEGKTLTAANLSAAIANGSQLRVLTIDADLRRPSLARVLGRPNMRRGWGLVDAILDRRLSLDQITWKREPFNISAVTSRRPQNDTYELLANGRFGELLAEARQRYDYVIVDTPPVLPTPDSRLIAEWVDGYVIVVTADKTPRRLLEETLHLLGPSKVLGLVFNRESYKHSRYGRYYYRAYTTRGER